jgi:hypothetical protein
LVQNSTLTRGGGIRVALYGLPRLMEDVIARLIGDQADMELVGATSTANAHSLICELGADVIIVGLQQDRPTHSHPVSESLTHIAVLGVTERGNRTVLYRLRPEVAEPGVSPADLLAATRGAVHRTHDTLNRKG